MVQKSAKRNHSHLGWKKDIKVYRKEWDKVPTLQPYSKCWPEFKNHQECKWCKSFHGNPIKVIKEEFSGIFMWGCGGCGDAWMHLFKLIWERCESWDCPKRRGRLGSRGWQGSYPPPPKFDIDTKNDGFLKCISFQIWHHFGYPAVSFRGCKGDENLVESPDRLFYIKRTCCNHWTSARVEEKFKHQKHDVLKSQDSDQQRFHLLHPAAWQFPRYLV